MKSKTRRQLARSWGDIRGIFNTVGIIVTVITVIVAPLLAITGLVFISWVLAIFWVLFLIVVFLIRRRLPRFETEYFEPIDFGEPNEESILRAVDGILNTQKVAPYYVHVAPQSNEVESICSKLRERGFVKLSGASGSGKSMAAFQAAFLVQSEEKCQVHRLKVEESEKKTSPEFGKLRDNILNQLDELAGNEKRLIIVDDAHRLAMGSGLLSTLRKETEESNGRIIWIETEFPSSEPEEVLEDECIRLSLANFFGRLLDGFYFNSDHLLQRALGQRVAGLDDAINRFRSGKIKDIWHFNFCVTQGWNRLAQKVLELNDFSLLVLFLISSHTVIRSEQELHTNDIVNMIRNLETIPDLQARFQWLREYGSVRNALEDLATRKLVQVYDKNPHDKGYVASLHYNFAREVIRSSLSREHLTQDLLTSVKLLLTDDYLSCEYFGVFHHDIDKHAESFDQENKNWLLGFLNSLLPVKMGGCSRLLYDMAKSARHVYEELLGHLEMQTISKRISSIPVGQFGALGHLLRSFGMKAKELTEQLDLSQLAKAASEAQPGDFGQLAYLLQNFGKQREDLVKELDLSQLAETTSAIQPGELGGLASLLRSLGNRREDLIKQLDFSQLAEVASAAQPGELGGLASLLEYLGNRCEDLIKELDFSQLAVAANASAPEAFPGLAKLLDSLGAQAKELVRELDFSQLAGAANASGPEVLLGLAQLLDSLGAQAKELVRELDLSQLAETVNAAQPAEFGGLASLLEYLGNRCEDLIKELDFSQLAVAANASAPEAFPGLAKLLDSLGAQAKELVRELDFSQLAGAANASGPEVLLGLAQLLDSLGSQSDELKGKLDFHKLAESASIVQAKNLDSVTGLVHALGGDKEKLTKELDFRKLANTANTIQLNQLEKLCGLLSTLGDQSGKLAQELDFGALKNKVEHVEEQVNEDWLQVIAGLTHLMAQLGEDHRNEFIGDIAWGSLCMKCPIVIENIGILGQCLENVVKQGEQAIIDVVQVHLHCSGEVLKDEISKANRGHYGGIAKFLWNYNEIEHTATLEIVEDTIDKLMTGFTIVPWNWKGVGQLINAINHVNHTLAESFVASDKVRGRIIQALNTQNWTERLAEARHLIKAFYRCAPSLWKTIVDSGWVTTDLSILDLDGVYREIDIEMN